MVYLRKRKTAFQYFVKSQNRYPTPPTPIFRSSSKQPMGTSDSFHGGWSHITPLKMLGGTFLRLIQLIFLSSICYFKSCKDMQLLESCKLLRSCEPTIRLHALIMNNISTRVCVFVCVCDFGRRRKVKRSGCLYMYYDV